MKRDELKKVIINALQKNADDLSYFDEIFFCLFSLKDLDLKRSTRFSDLRSVEELKDLNLLTTDIDEYVDYAITAHEANAGMMYGCFGVLGDTYYIATFRFKISPAGKIRRNNGMLIAPHLSFSPDWLVDYYLDNRGKITIKDVALKIKLDKFLKE